ncbi:protein kinase domain-containing protein [Nocardia sp. CA-136227]|uniref:protein kinase domain-containing protein n=1 Tax=Nocardia sp. CA-136227 TaxID=3239979 RepID=UPI003D957085
MELVPGGTVGSLLAEPDHIPTNWAACITAQVFAVLTAAHEAGLIHRDVKPSNLVLCPTGYVKLIDSERRPRSEPASSPPSPHEAIFRAQSATWPLSCCGARSPPSRASSAFPRRSAASTGRSG